MISPVLHQIFLHCSTSTIILVFTLQNQSSYKIKRDDFTELLLSLPLGPLKIACHMGAFDMLHILELTYRPPCDSKIWCNMHITGGYDVIYEMLRKVWSSWKHVTFTPRSCNSLLAAALAAVGLQAAPHICRCIRCGVPRATAPSWRQPFSPPDGLICPWRAPCPASPCCLPNAVVAPGGSRGLGYSW